MEDWPSPHAIHAAIERGDSDEMKDLKKKTRAYIKELQSSLDALRTALETSRDSDGGHNRRNVA